MDQSIISKPTILLYTTQHISEDVLKPPLLYGIEEEDLPVVIESHSGTHIALADLASRNSALSVGIGVDDQAIVLTYKNIPAHQFIYRLSGYSQYPDSLRTLGVNAARLVKGNPFVSDKRLEVAF
nr:glycerol dehydratase reactivase beta/small subunit family protein [Veillonella denticariosi]